MKGIKVSRTESVIQKLQVYIEMGGGDLYDIEEGIEEIRKLSKQHDVLLNALKMIAGVTPCIDNLMSDKDIARAAIEAVEGEKT